MKKLLTIGILIDIVILLLPAVAHAQPPDFPNGSAPVDGGLSLLLAGGIGYGIRKIREKNENNKQQNKT